MGLETSKIKRNYCCHFLKVVKAVVQSYEALVVYVDDQANEDVANC